MKTLARLLKTKLSLLLALFVIATAAVYFLSPDVSADSKRNNKPKPPGKTVKRKTVAKQTRPKAQQLQLPASIADIGGAAMQSERLPNLFSATPAQEFLDQWIGDKRVKSTGLKHQTKRADDPDKAIQYFLRKRLPQGETELPVEKYFEAMDEMKRMNVFSTAENRLMTREELRINSPEQPRLGTWTSLGPGNIGGRTRSILINPNNPNVMYAAGVAGGVWKTTNGGTSWTPIADLIANIAVASMAFDPKNPDVIYVGTGEGFQNGDSVRGAGIFKTSDAGVTWSRLPNTGNLDFYFVNDLVVSNNDSKRIYAATRTGVWRSTDEGLNWTAVVQPNVNGGCLDLAARTDQQTDFLFAACGNFQQSSIYRKSNAEAAGGWDQVLTEAGMGRTAIAIAPSNQDVVYAISAELSGAYVDGLHAFFRSDSGGSSGTWTARVRNTDTNKVNTAILSNLVNATATECKFGTANFFTGQSWYDLAIAVDPLDFNRVWVGSIDVFRSDDGGANWGAAAFAYDGTGGPFVYGKPNQLHPDQHFFVFHPQFNGTTNQQMFIGNDGGIWKTSNARAVVSTGPRAFCDSSVNKVQWTPLNNGYGVTQFYHGSVFPDGKTYLGGTQDNGTARGNDTDGPNKWNQIVLADGGYSAVDFLNPKTLYASTQNAGFRKSTDAGATFSSTTFGLGGALDFITPMLMDTSDPARLYTGGSLLFRSDKMTLWNNLGSLQNTSLTAGILSALAIAPTDANYGLFGLNNGVIIRTTRALALSPINQLSSAVERVTQPRTGFVSCVAFDPNDRNISYATYSTFTNAHVWKTTNAGESWTPIDGTGGAGIPDVPVHCIVIDPSNSARLYVGTDLGVFVSLDGGATWTVENTGFANVITETLVLNVTGGVSTLYAFTHGRGTYKVTANMSGCNVALSKTGSAVAAAGSDLTVDVTVAPGGCNWRAESNVPWITLQPGAGGSSNGTVGMKVTANPNIGPRFGTVNIAGRSFTVTQDGAADLDSPTLRITTPATSPNNTPNAFATLSGTATDNLRVATVTWRSNRVQGGTVSNTGTSNTLNWSFTVTLLAGVNEITAVATDDAGNVGAARNVTINVAAPSSLLTIAGTGTNGFSGDNGQAISANISRPMRMTFDAAGNLYFADLNNHRVRRVAPNGVITTIAGNGSAGFSGDNGPATSAQLNGPLGVALDRNGNLLIADTVNQRIRRVNAATNVITTVAGTGDAGFNGDGGAATTARVTLPENIFVDKDNNIFIADNGNNRIRKVAANGGTISTVAGTGTSGFSGDGGQATAANLSSPNDVVVDNAGNIFICAAGNNRIRKVTTDGVINTIAGNGNTAFNGDGILATAAAINNPGSIALDAIGNVYIVDRGNSRIRKVTVSNDSISTLAGGNTGLSPDGSSTTLARLNLPTGIALDAAGNVFFSDRDNFRIRRIANAVSGDTAGPVVAITPSIPSGLNPNPIALSGTATDSGTVTLVRWSNDRGGSGTAIGTTSWSIPAVSLQPGVNNLTITAWDATGNAGSVVLVVNYQAPQVVVTIAGTGIGAQSADGGPGTAASVWFPRDVVVDALGNVIFTDNLNRRVRKISPAGVISVFAGTGEVGSGGDGGQAKDATFNSPSGIAIDAAGNVFISDQATNRIRRIGADGVITTVAGNGTGFGGYGGDGGLAKDAELNFPQDLAVDKDGNLLIADYDNNRIRKVTIADGKISTIAGTGLYGFSGDGGLATQADLATPTGVAVDGAGNIYIADLGNQRIRRIAASDAKISTIAGTGAAGFSGDNSPAMNAQINLAPQSFMAVDAAGDVYFADRVNNRIRKITINTGIITTIAGTGTAGFNGDGTAPTGTNLSLPTGVAVDSSGALVIADNAVHRVRRTQPAAGLRTVATVSAASFSQTAGVAPEEIVAGFGPGLASSVVVASSLPLPTSLGGTTVKVRDSQNVDRLAPLFFVSPDQVNYQIPSGTAAGLATVIVTNAVGETITGTVTVANVAPSLFTANSSGTGLSAAVVFRRNAAGVDTYESAAGPIDLGPTGDIVLLIPYGTGLRGFSDLANVQATIGGVNAPIFFVGPTPGFVGLDQVNMLIDRSLIGKGTVDVVLTIDGKKANTVTVTIK